MGGFLGARHDQRKETTRQTLLQAALGKPDKFEQIEGVAAPAIPKSADSEFATTRRLIGRLRC
jgi:hypothetical protein